MDVKKLFDAARAAGIQTFEVRIAEDDKLQVETYDSQVENYTVAKNSTLSARGEVNGKTGAFTTDRIDDGNIDTVIAAVKQAAEYGDEFDCELIVGHGKYEYERVGTYNAALASVTPTELIGIAERVSRAASNADKRVKTVNVQLEYSDEKYTLANSAGLLLERRANYAFVYASVKAENGGDVQSYSHYEFVTDITKFDAEKFAATLVSGAVGMLGGASIGSGRYTAVFAPTAAATLISALCSSFSAFNAEKKMSLLDGKIGKKVFSPSFTLEQTPIGCDVFCKPFDAEGVPCKNRLLIDGGVPTGYVYDLATAKRAKVGSTGNGVVVGGNIRPAVGYVTVHGGELSQERLFERIGDGVYITELAGAHAGLSAQTGNYSLQASGYKIVNGKKAAPISLMTVAGNLMNDFNNIVGLADDGTLTYHAVKTPSIAVADVAISGVDNK